MESHDLLDSDRFDHLFDTAHNLAEMISIPPAGDSPYTLLVGAGASVSSGVRPAAALIDAWKQDLYRALSGATSSAAFDKQQFASWLETEYPLWLEARLRGRTRESEYAVLFSRFHKSRRGRQVFIEREIDGKLPAFGYLYLAGLVASRKINKILTTNFDDLINDAIVKFYDIKPIVCAFDSAIRSIRFDSLRPKILKLHGDFLYDNIKNVGDEVVRLDANMEEKFLHTCKEGGLIVVGYDGNDESIMGPLQMMVRSNDYLKMGLHWCLYQPDPTKRPVVPSRLRHLLDNYSDRITLYPIAGFDELMHEVFSKCGCVHPEAFINPGRKNLFKEFQRTIKGQWASYEVPAGMNEHLELYLEKSGQRSLDPELELDQADVKHRKANLLVKGGNFQEANRFFEASHGQAIDALALIDNKDILLQFRAYGRLSGALVGRLECLQKLNMPWESVYQDALDAVKKAEHLRSDHSVTHLPLKDRRIPYYNALCTYALGARMRTLDDTECSNANAYLLELKALDPRGEDQQNLKEECGFTELAGSLDGYNTRMALLNSDVSLSSEDRSDDQQLTEATSPAQKAPQALMSAEHANKRTSKPPQAKS